MKTKKLKKFVEHTVQEELDRRQREELPPGRINEREPREAGFEDVEESDQRRLPAARRPLFDGTAGP